jgi:hypothetical protein
VRRLLGILSAVLVFTIIVGSAFWVRSDQEAALRRFLEGQQQEQAQARSALMSQQAASDKQLRDLLNTIYRNLRNQPIRVQTFSGQTVITRTVPVVVTRTVVVCRLPSGKPCP